MSGNVIDRYLLDTNIIIYSAQDKINLADFMEKNDDMFISSITYIEAFGFPFIDKQEEDKITNTCAMLKRFFLTEEIEKQTINIRKSKKIKLPDAIIAATAIVHDLTLVTANSEDFKNIPELKILNPFNI
jgi:predicted nucleic acid-binding protein